MKKIRLISLLLCWVLGPGIKGFGQLLSPLQPEQDACAALVICGNSFTTPYSYIGAGNIIESTSPIQEDNSMWMRLNVSTAGSIVFTIAPIDTLDDYDFAVFDISALSCSTFTNANAVRYNFNNNYVGSNAAGIVGLNDTATIQFVPGGTYGNSFCQQINANAGETYLIMVNNWGSFGNAVSAGFTIDFTGSTATFNQPPVPAFSQISSYCNYQDLVVTLDQPILCSSIATDGSDFSLTPSGSIAAAEGVGCAGNLGYTTQVKVSFAAPLANGNYTLHAQTGTDNNTLLNLCNGALVLPDALGFSVDVEPLQYVKIDTPACRVLSVHMSKPVSCESIAADGTDFAITGPSAVNILSASGAPGCVPGGTGGFTQIIKVTLTQPIPVDGLYTLVAQVGSDGNTLIDSCGVVQVIGDTTPFTVHSFNGKLKALPDSTVCSGVDAVALYGHNNGTPPASGFVYQWQPASQVQQPGSLNTLAQISSDNHDFVLETIDGPGCYLRDSAKILFAPATVGELTPEEATICLGDRLQLNGAGGEVYRWFDNAAFNQADNTTLSCPDCPDPLVTPSEGTHTYYLIVASQQGCRDTLQAQVLVHPLPVITASPEEKTIRYGSNVPLKAEGGLGYQWSPADYLDQPNIAEPLASQVLRPMMYTVSGTNEYGCINSALVHINLDMNLPDLIPNAFSPNGDGLNDVFTVAGLTYQKLEEFRVFNRWGTCIFQTMHTTKGWDGTYGGQPADAGTYFYTIRLRYPDGSEKQYKGDIQLIR